MSIEEKTNHVKEYANSASEAQSIDSITEKNEPVNTIQNNGDICESNLCWNVNCEQSINFHIDCGATVNVLPKKDLKTRDLQPTSKVLQMWNKTEIRPVGTVRKSIRNPGNCKKYNAARSIISTLTHNLNPSALTASRLLPNFLASAKLLFRLSR